MKTIRPGVGIFIILQWLQNETFLNQFLFRSLGRYYGIFT